jgi:hypothetical protein
VSLLQLQLERNHSYHCETAILENLDGLLERHTVLSGQGETYNGKVMEWKIASTRKEQIDLWIAALSRIKLCLYYQPLSGESEALSHLAQRMMNIITICDRWYYFKVYTSCFIGSEAVSWLTSELNCSLSEAIQIGNKMLNLNFFYHVVREHFFCNAYYFYRFNKVIRTVKKRVSSSRSMSHLENGTSSGRLSEQGYCVCDLYPRQSELLSQSSQNLSQLVEEISFPHSMDHEGPSTAINLASQTFEEKEHDQSQSQSPKGDEDPSLGSTKEPQQGDGGEEEQSKQLLVSSSNLHEEDEGSDCDWKVGSLDSQEHSDVDSVRRRSDGPR